MYCPLRKALKCLCDSNLSNNLGFTRARFTVNDLARARREEINFLVDSGSRFVIFDLAMAQKLRLKPLTKVKLMMADKRLVEADIAACLVSWKGNDAPIFAAIVDVPEPLIGVEALEALGLSIDPTTGSVKETRKHPSYLL